jgi:hypothetical protein
VRHGTANTKVTKTKEVVTEKFFVTSCVAIVTFVFAVLVSL